MANKVLSIKMDEKDIERLRKYYEVLVSSGFLSGKTMSLNAFYKHLLLDYLEDDVSRAFATYSAYGITPRCINPESMDDNENFKLNNAFPFIHQTIFYKDVSLYNVIQSLSIFFHLINISV